MNIYINRDSKFLGMDADKMFYFEALKDNNPRSKVIIALKRLDDDPIDCQIIKVYKKQGFKLDSENAVVIDEFNYYYNYTLIPLPIIGVIQIGDTAVLTGTMFEEYWVQHYNTPKEKKKKVISWNKMSTKELADYCSSLIHADESWPLDRITVHLANGETHGSYLRRQKYKNETILKFLMSVDCTKLNDIDITVRNIQSRVTRHIIIKKKIDTSENIYKLKMKQEAPPTCE